MIAKRTNTKKTFITAGQPRRKVRSFVATKRVMAATMGSLIILGSTFAFWAFEAKEFRQMIVRAKWEIIGATVRLGFRVEDILVVGRRETPREELRKAVRLAKGAPIFTFDIQAARHRVEGLPWVRAAQIERVLPDTILLKVEEREPLALWQHNGQFALIDYEGIVILREDLGRFSDLVVVVGEGAQMRAAALMEILGNEPELLALVEAAAWVGGRRWNVHLKGNIDVRLPEKDAKNAWARLAEYVRVHSILERDVRVLDLRLPDRLIVRKTPRSNPLRNKDERET